jgi:hypothetical protein
MRALGMAALAVWALAAAPALATPKQFDLTCTGTVKDASGADAQPWSTRLSVDLNTKAWCATGCVSAQPIARMESSRVWLRDDGLRNANDPTAPILSINRLTGELTARDENGRRMQATCQLAPFTRFEKKLF